MTTALIAPVTEDVGLDPTGIRRLAMDARRRATTRTAIVDAAVHELDCLRKRRYRAAEALELIDAEMKNLKVWLERERGARQV